VLAVSQQCKRLVAPRLSATPLIPKRGSQRRLSTTGAKRFGNTPQNVLLPQRPNRVIPAGAAKLNECIGRLGKRSLQTEL
jgi:hypothetical protein